MGTTSELLRPRAPFPSSAFLILVLKHRGWLWTAPMRESGSKRERLRGLPLRMHVLRSVPPGCFERHPRRRRERRRGSLRTSPRAPAGCLPRQPDLLPQGLLGEVEPVQRRPELLDSFPTQADAWEAWQMKARDTLRSRDKTGVAELAAVVAKLLADPPEVKVSLQWNYAAELKAARARIAARGGPRRPWEQDTA